MSDGLKVIGEVQQRTAWKQSGWAVALVALGIGSSLAVSKLSWWYTLAILIPTFILGYLLKDKIANPFVLARAPPAGTMRSSRWWRRRRFSGTSPSTWPGTMPR